MCRMIVLQAGRMEDAYELLRGFAAQSGDSRAGPRPEGHDDGWGLVAAGPAGVGLVARSVRPLSRDPEFLEAVDSLGDRPPRFLLAHARQASRGAVRVENCHPFVRDGLAFMHNGTVDGDWRDVAPRCAGDTDSERLFQRVLDRVRKGIGPGQALWQTVEGLPARAFTSATVVATDGHDVFAVRRLGTMRDEFGVPRPERYGLFEARWKQSRIWAQETTHLPKIAGRRQLPEGRLIRWPSPTKVSSGASVPSAAPGRARTR